MKYKLGDILSLQHYSSVRLFSASVRTIDGDMVRLGVSREFLALRLQPADPLVAAAEEEGEISSVGCSILEKDPAESCIQVRLEISKVENERRLYRRYPLSLYADIIPDEHARKKTTVILKDMSEYGLRIFTNAGLNIGQTIEIDIYTESSVLFLKGSVIRISNGSSYNEYGIRLKYESFSSANLVKQYIRKLDLAHERYLAKLSDARHWAG